MADYGAMCPVFRPTREDFEQPFCDYVRKVFRKHPDLPMFKVVPPRGWKPRRTAFPDLRKVQINVPIRQHVFGTKGAYRCLFVEQKPMSVADFRLAAEEEALRLRGGPGPESREGAGVRASSRSTSSRNNRPPVDHEAHVRAAAAPEADAADAPAAGADPDAVEADLERSFWSNVTLNPPMYGADTPTSFFDDKLPYGWNLQHLGDLLQKHPKVDAVPGVTTPMTYFGMWRSFFGWHKEDADLYSVNFLHWGAPKVWYGVAPSAKYKFERMAQSLFPELHRACPAFVRHKDIMLSPSCLKMYGVTYMRACQRPNEFVVLNAAAYHAGFNSGFNCAEAVNFGMKEWIPVGKEAIPCRCSALKDGVRLSMKLFDPKWVDPYESPDDETSEAGSESEEAGSESEEADGSEQPQEEEAPVKRKRGRPPAATKRAAGGGVGKKAEATVTAGKVGKKTAQPTAGAGKKGTTTAASKKKKKAAEEVVDEEEEEEEEDDDEDAAAMEEGKPRRKRVATKKAAAAAAEAAAVTARRRGRPTAAVAVAGKQMPAAAAVAAAAPRVTLVKPAASAAAAAVRKAVAKVRAGGVMKTTTSTATSAKTKTAEAAAAAAEKAGTRGPGRPRKTPPAGEVDAAVAKPVAAAVASRDSGGRKRKAESEEEKEPEPQQEVLGRGARRRSSTAAAAPTAAAAGSTPAAAEAAALTTVGSKRSKTKTPVTPTMTTTTTAPAIMTSAPPAAEANIVNASAGQEPTAAAAAAALTRLLPTRVSARRATKVAAQQQQAVVGAAVAAAPPVAVEELPETTATTTNATAVVAAAIPDDVATEVPMAAEGKEDPLPLADDQPLACSRKAAPAVAKVAAAVTAPAPPAAEPESAATPPTSDSTTPIAAEGGGGCVVVGSTVPTAAASTDVAIIMEGGASGVLAIPTMPKAAAALPTTTSAPAAIGDVAPPPTRPVVTAVKPRSVIAEAAKGLKAWTNATPCPGQEHLDQPVGPPMAIVGDADAPVNGGRRTTAQSAAAPPPPPLCPGPATPAGDVKTDKRFFFLVQRLARPAPSPGNVMLRWLKEGRDGLYRAVPGSVWEEAASALLPVMTQPVTTTNGAAESVAVAGSEGDVSGGGEGASGSDGAAAAAVQELRSSSQGDCGVMAAAFSGPDAWRLVTPRSEIVGVELRLD